MQPYKCYLSYNEQLAVPLLVVNETFPGLTVWNNLDDWNLKELTLQVLTAAILNQPCSLKK